MTNKLRQLLEADAERKANDVFSIGLVQAFQEGHASTHDLIINLVQACEKAIGHHECEILKEALAKLHKELGGGE